MCDYDLQSDFDIKGLCLIDVTAEDDCLIDTPFLDTLSGGELEEDETKGNGRKKLHKSMTWDSSFFSSAAFLEPEEFSSREYVNRSPDSSTMSPSKREHLEADFDEDNGASIQKSNSVSDNAVYKELERKDSRIVSSSKRLEYSNPDKVKQKAAPKKPNKATKDPGKTMKQASARPQTSQACILRINIQLLLLLNMLYHERAVSTPSLRKPLNVLARRASLGAKDFIMEKDAKSPTGRGTTISKTPAMDGSRNILPRTPRSSRSSTLSSSSNSSMDMIKQNNNSDLVNSSSSSYTSTNASKSAAKGKRRTGHSTLSTSLKSPTKLHSSISIASSSSGEWSSEGSLSSPTSNANKRSNVVRVSLGSSSLKGLVTESDAQQVSDLRHTHQPSLGDGDEVTGSVDESESKASDGRTWLLHQAAIKPSGLRPPSPKLAFSNGVRLSRHNRTRSVPSFPAALIGMPKIEEKSTNPSDGSNKASPRALQRSTTIATKAQSASRNPKISPGMSLKLHNKLSQKTSRESYSKAQGIRSAEKPIGSDLPKLVVKVGGKDGSRIKDTKVVPLAVPEY
ncbi:uncharacterized protein LOC120158134 [Hibiscus syriacus]|uniref:uncharacterized protein LOC120158134 n=1 Tax=Hibiscus syriacus TaxID=106335 RepID=UPI00192171D9|nr:uncharacterized protein LOC120158134 [Hibiscus syriacus]